MLNIKPSIWWLRGVLIVGVVISFCWVVYLYFGGTGTLQLTYHFNGSEQAISRFQPHGRALDLEQNQDNGETYQRLVAEPAYFTTTLPGSYDTVAVTLEYQNPWQTLIELGVKQTEDPAIFDYLMQPLENKLVDDSDWSRLETDQQVLLQREPVYASIEDFIAHPPVDAYVGTYLNAPLPQFQDPTYQPGDTGSDINVTLRGKHEFYSYATMGEAMIFDVTVATINYVAGDDAVTATLYQGDTAIATQTVVNVGTVHLAVQAPTTGVYRLVVEASDDTMITEVRSSQERLVVGHAIHLAGSVEYQATGLSLNTNPTTITSDANWMTMMAKHSYGVGSYSFYDGDFSLNKIDTPYTWQNPVANYPLTVTFPNNDIYLQSDSYFALPGAMAFDPWFGFRPISFYTDEDNLDYVWSGVYESPTRLRGWTTATAEFDLTSVTQNRPNTLQFLLSAPGLGQAPEGLKVRSISVTAKQQPLTLSLLWQKLFGAN